MPFKSELLKKAVWTFNKVKEWRSSQTSLAYLGLLTRVSGQYPGRSPANICFWEAIRHLLCEIGSILSQYCNPDARHYCHWLDNILRPRGTPSNHLTIITIIHSLQSLMGRPGFCLLHQQINIAHGLHSLMRSLGWWSCQITHYFLMYMSSFLPFSDAIILQMIVAMAQNIVFYFNWIKMLCKL